MHRASAVKGLRWLWFPFSEEPAAVPLCLIRHLLCRFKVRLGQRHQILPGWRFQTGHPITLGGDQFFKQVPHLSAVGEVGRAGLVQVGEERRQEVFQFLVRLLLILFAQSLKDSLKLRAGVVVKVEILLEPRFQAGVGVQKALHGAFITGHHHHELISMILHGL